MLVLQYGHSLVVGSAAGWAAGFCRQFTCLTIMKITRAMIKKLMMLF
jgi:hypothetical protein